MRARVSVCGGVRASSVDRGEGPSQNSGQCRKTPETDFFLPSWLSLYYSMGNIASKKRKDRPSIIRTEVPDEEYNSNNATVCTSNIKSTLHCSWFTVTFHRPIPSTRSSSMLMQARHRRTAVYRRMAQRIASRHQPPWKHPRIHNSSKIRIS